MDEDRRSLFGAVLLVAFGLVVAGLDLMDVIQNGVDLNKHIPFLLSAALFAFAAMVVTMVRHARSCPRCRSSRIEDRCYAKESFLHESHRPKGRTDAPDGLSD